MASTREIKNRIKSVSDTQKITNAMYLISSTKMRKARESAEQGSPYYNMLKREIRRIFAVSDDADISTRYVDSSVDDEQAGGRNGIIVVTGDKGLCGSYNQNVIKEAEKLIAKSDDYVVMAVGDVGWRYFKSHDYKIDESFTQSMNEPSLAMARNITVDVLDKFDNLEFDRIYVCYTEFKGGLSAGEATTFRMLPFDKDDFVAEGNEFASDARNIFEYVPDVNTVLEKSLRYLMIGYTYACLVNSYSAEQTARMMAMDSANDNAGELLDELKLTYNHMRQGAITQEITEISSGARSLKKKKK